MPEGPGHWLWLLPHLRDQLQQGGRWLRIVQRPAIATAVAALLAKLQASGGEAKAS